MPVNPRHYGTFTIMDYSKEKSTMSFDFDAITAAALPAFLTEFGALRTATEAIILGSIVHDSWVGDATIYNVAPPADENAQRERKFLVVTQDVVTFAKYKLEIPCADLTGRMLPNTDLVDLTDVDIAAWITAYENLCQSPESNDLNVIEIRAVGRNL